MMKHLQKPLWLALFVALPVLVMLSVYLTLLEISFYINEPKGPAVALLVFLCATAVSALFYGIVRQRFDHPPTGVLIGLFSALASGSILLIVQGVHYSFGGHEKVVAVLGLGIPLVHLLIQLLSRLPLRNPLYLVPFIAAPLISIALFLMVPSGYGDIHSFIYDRCVPATLLFSGCCVACYTAMKRSKAGISICAALLLMIPPVLLITLQLLQLPYLSVLWDARIVTVLSAVPIMYLFFYLFGRSYEQVPWPYLSVLFYTMPVVSLGMHMIMPMTGYNLIFEWLYFAVFIALIAAAAFVFVYSAAHRNRVRTSTGTLLALLGMLILLGTILVKYLYALHIEMYRPIALYLLLGLALLFLSIQLYLNRNIASNRKIMRILACSIPLPVMLATIFSRFLFWMGLNNVLLFLGFSFLWTAALFLILWLSSFIKRKKPLSVTDDSITRSDETAEHQEVL